MTAVPPVEFARRTARELQDGPSDVTSTLSLSGVSKSFGSVRVLSGIDIDLRPGEVVALLGENGAGKSTLANILGGVITPTDGTMSWRGATYEPHSPSQAIDQGVAVIHQELRLISDLSVAENVLLGRLPTRGPFVDRRRMRQRCTEILRMLGYRGSLDTNVRNLRVAEQQLVEIAKALLQEPSFLILDEPTAALGDGETSALFERVRELRDRGVGFVYVSHRLSEIAQIADRIVVLRDGRAVSEYSSGTIDPDTLVQDMVGRPIERLYPDRKPVREEVVLKVDSLSHKHGRFADVSFEVHAGEVFGIAGIVGAGRTELLRAIASIDAVRSGRVTVRGKQVLGRHPRDAIRCSIGFVPEDRAREGLLLDDSAERNLVLPTISRDTRFGFVHRRSLARRARRSIERFDVRGRTSGPVRRLSGGNQQKVVIGKALEADPSVVLLDEPTRGIDVGARAAIYRLIADLAAEGKAIVLVSSDLEELVGLSHRVLVLADGCPKDVLRGADVAPEKIMTLAV